ncbi:hypothetical protein [Brevundimonas diminuta]|uniref:hypothetical protein n=1 Tax=Brevundimonas diminuta TaxID=293 RepID=UPI000B3615A0|nr:hypothetical protein [Brevundimonas diminuta]
MAFLKMMALAAGLVSAEPGQVELQAGVDPQAAQVDDVEVVARMRATQVRERVNAFIESNMAPPHGRPLARWNKPVCVATAYLNPQYAQAVIDRVAARIIEAGGDVAEPGCKVDIMIVGTDDGPRTAKELVKDDPRGYRPSRGSTDRGGRALRRFQEGDAPVRWWHVSLPVNVDTGELAVRLDGEDYPTNTVRDASRLRSNVRDDLARVTVIVDFTQTSQVQSSALVDYIAFVALAQVNPEGDLDGQDTILNLFERPTEYAAMTQWDRDYLAALYSVVPNRPNIHAQTRGIASQVIRQREHH